MGGPAQAQVSGGFNSSRPAIRIEYWQKRLNEIEQRLAATESLEPIKVLFLGDENSDGLPHVEQKMKQLISEPQTLLEAKGEPVVTDDSVRLFAETVNPSEVGRQFEPHDRRWFHVLAANHLLP